MLPRLSVLASPAEQGPGSGESGNGAFLTERGSAGRGKWRVESGRSAAFGVKNE